MTGVSGLMAVVVWVFAFIGLTVADPERSMWHQYSLFSFGLLKEADVCEMLALALPARVQLLNITSSYYQVDDPKRRAEKAFRRC